MTSRRNVLLGVTFGMIVVVNLGVYRHAMRLHCNPVVS
jgi:hypothetical protein